MKKLSATYRCLQVALLLVMVKPLFGQIPDFSKVSELQEGDSLNIVYLINNGVRIADGKVIAWFPKDSLSEERMREITDMLKAGIHEAEKYIHAPLSWQVHKPTDTFTFYFRYDRFVSHASNAGFVSIPFWRIREGKSPWLHEVMHEMLNTKTGSWLVSAVTEKEWSEQMPLWLFEGLPDYISLEVCLANDLPWFDVFSNSRQTNMDSLFVEEEKSAKGKYILSFIGAKGVIPELFSKERRLYAPAFYHGAHSFVKYLAGQYGVKVLLTAVSSFQHEQEIIEKLTGKPLELLKKEWLDKLGIGK